MKSIPQGSRFRQSYQRTRSLSSRSLVSRIAARINFPLIIVVALLVCYGLLVVYSAIIEREGYSFSHQVFGAGLGVAIMCAVGFFDYRKLANMTVPLLIVSAFLIILPFFPVIGVNINGARWVMIFGQQIQPSEFAKPFVILYLAALISKYHGNLTSLREYLKALGMILIPILLVLMQPDLGTGLVFFVIGVVVLFVGGAKRKWLIITVILVVALVVMALVLDGILDERLGRDVLLKDYQKNRLLVFLNEDIDPTGISYNLKQAKIAIGSGGLLGKGFGNATQALLGFLPETPTDFIFCVLAEQFGFVGSLLLIGLYVALALVALHIARSAKNTFGLLIAVSAIAMWVFHAFQNIGMTCGLMPITGIPLPFVSYGSSFMVVNFITVGLLCSIWSHRDAIISK